MTLANAKFGRPLININPLVRDTITRTAVALKTLTLQVIDVSRVNLDRLARRKSRKSAVGTARTAEGIPTRTTLTPALVLRVFKHVCGNFDFCRLYSVGLLFSTATGAVSARLFARRAPACGGLGNKLHFLVSIHQQSLLVDQILVP